MTEEKKTCVLGFALLLDAEGNAYLETNPEAFSAEVARPATLREVRRYTSELLMDINAQSAAEYTLVKLASANQKASEAFEKSAETE